MNKRKVGVLLGVVLALIASPLAAANNSVGINIAAPLDWERNRAFADVMKTARDWTLPDSEAAAPLDSKGWPTGDAQCPVWAGIDRMHGTYRLSFTGQATVSFEWGTATIRNQVYHAASDTTTADVEYPDADGEALLIRFSGTHGGVRNVALMRPLYPGSSRSYPTGTLFTDQFKNALAPFTTLRFMDFTATNWNQQETWNSRVQPDAASFNRTAANYGWQGRGAAWEYVVALANQTHKDAWICIPAHADDDYVACLARLFRDGNPAAGFAALDPELKLYVEYSNEVWNWGFEQAEYNDQQAAAELSAGDPYGYGFGGDSWAAAWRRVARKTADISLIFRSLFGDAQMMTRIRPVFCWQAVYKATGQDPLKYLEEAYIPRFAPGRPVSYLIWGGGGSAYYNPDNNSDSLTLDNIWTSQSMSTFLWGKDGGDEENPGREIYNAQVCRTFGINRVAYEGGPSLDNTGHSESVKAAAVLDPRMRDSVLQHHAAWNRWAGGLLMYYTLTHDYPWAFAADVLDLDTPKMEAVTLLASAEPETVSLGSAVPGTVDGNAFDVGYYAWDEPGSGSISVGSGRWYSYLFRFPGDGNYRLSASVANPSGSLVFLVDGRELPSQALPAASTATVTSTVDLTGGLHSVRVRAEGGRFDLVKVMVSAVNLQLLSPNGGEIWPRGEARTVSWQGTNPDDSLRLVLFNGTSKVGSVAFLAAGRTSFSWTVGRLDSGADILPGSKYRLRIIDNVTAVSDFSDAFFTIAGLQLTAPNGGESWPRGNLRTVTWKAPGMTGTVRLVLFRGSTKLGTIASGIAASAGSYTWTVGSYSGGTAPAGSDYRVKVCTPSGSVTDTSDAGFTIAP